MKWIVAKWEILDASCKKADFKKTANKLQYLNNNKHSLILKLLRKNEELFDITLGNYTGSEYKIELSEGAKTDHAKLFPIPKIIKETLKIEVNWYIKLSVLKHKNNSELAPPTFIIPVSFLTLENWNKVIEIRRFQICHLTWFKYGILSY